MTKYTIEVQEGDDGDSFIELPEELLKTLDLSEGDMIRWVPNEAGTEFTLEKVYLDEPIQLDLFGGKVNE